MFIPPWEILEKMEQPNFRNIAERNSITEREVLSIIEMVKRGMEPSAKRIPVIENGKRQYYLVERRGVGVLNTKYGKFWEFEFAIDDDWENYSVIVRADIDKELLIPILKDESSLTLRIDSGCKTGQVFGDVTCECNEQLNQAMKTLTERGEGMIINVPAQDGRGMGISFKLATLWLQDTLGVDTVESASMIAPGGVIDIRTYSGIIGILKFFNISETSIINLASNNPKKARIFEENGYKLGDFIPVIIQPNKHTEKHLRAKQEKLGHIGLIDN